MFKELYFLIHKEIKLEWRQKYAFSGLLLYIISTIFICYLSFKRIIDPPTWNALFWIIMLFTGVNAVAKSFLQENPGRKLYYYTLHSPQMIILSKIIYNVLLMSVLSLINLLFYTIFVGSLIQDVPVYLICVLLGSAGFSSLLTMISAISSKAGHNTTLMAVLSFPIIIPLLITIIKVSKNAMDGLDISVSYPYITILVAINVMVVAMAYILFPYLWKD